MMTSSDSFFHFSKIFKDFSRFSKFWVVRRVKGQKMAQNEKKISHSVSQEPYLIWLWFKVQFCKMMISPAVFFIFSKFWFLGFSGGRTKNDHNYQFQSITLYISRTVDHSSRFLVHRCKIMISSGVFLCFFGKCSIGNIKIPTFFIGPLQQFFNKQLFFKFVNKYQTEILRCSPTFFTCVWFFNPLSTNPTKWSNTLKQFVGC